MLFGVNCFEWDTFGHFWPLSSKKLLIFLGAFIIIYMSVFAPSQTRLKDSLNRVLLVSKVNLFKNICQKIIIYSIDIL